MLMPTMNVKSGVREFNIPVKELLRCVSANGKRIAGIPLPSQPDATRYFHFSLGTLPNDFIRNGAMQRNAANILIAPISKGVKESSPRFMRINELPQTRARMVMRVKEVALLLPGIELLFEFV